LALSISAAALVGLAVHEQVWARNRADVEPMAFLDAEPPELDEALAIDDGPRIPVAQPVADAPIPATDSAPAEHDASTDAPTTVAVPELVGLRLRPAVRELKAAGLRVSVRDEYGERVPVVAWGDYEVEGQKFEPGTEVEPGTWVRMKVVMDANFAEGY
jgi:hypothetical protein